MSMKAQNTSSKEATKFLKRKLKSKIANDKQTFQLGTFDVGEGVLDPGEWLNVGDAGSMTERGLMMVPV